MWTSSNFLKPSLLLENDIVLQQSLVVFKYPKIKQACSTQNCFVTCTQLFLVGQTKKKLFGNFILPNSMGLSLGKSETVTPVFGIDAAGKTTLLYKVRVEGVNPRISMTLFYNFDEVYITPSSKLVAVDTGFSSSQSHYNKNVLYRILQSAIFRNNNYILNGWIYMVDANDIERLPEVQDDLHFLVNNYPQLQTLPLLILLNKVDLPLALREGVEIMDRLNLPQLKNTNYYLRECIATTGEGIYEGLDWLSSQSKPNSNDKSNL